MFFRGREVEVETDRTGKCCETPRHDLNRLQRKTKIRMEKKKNFAKRVVFAQFHIYIFYFFIKEPPTFWHPTLT